MHRNAPQRRDFRDYAPPGRGRRHRCIGRLHADAFELAIDFCAIAAVPVALLRQSRNEVEFLALFRACISHENIGFADCAAVAIRCIFDRAGNQAPAQTVGRRANAACGANFRIDSIVGIPRLAVIILICALDEDVAGARKPFGFAIIVGFCGDFAFRHAFAAAAFQPVGASIIVCACFAVTDFRPGLFDARQICAANLAFGAGQSGLTAFGFGFCRGHFGAQRICTIAGNAIRAVGASFAVIF